MNAAEIPPGTEIVALLGDPVAHSLSPRMQAAAFAAAGLPWAYVALRVLPSDLRAALAGLRALGFAGANVTVPHKEATCELVDDLDECARRCGAVNTIVFGEGRRLLGRNTDVAGVERALAEAGVGLAGLRAAVVGAGGAARAACVALASGGAAEIAVLSRDVERAEFLCGQMSALSGKTQFEAFPLEPTSLRVVLRGVDLLINATPVGMHPDVDRSPIPSTEMLRAGLAVFDMVYNPAQTKLLWMAREAGGRTISGLEMLVWQGAASFELWTGKPAPLEAMRRAVGLVDPATATG
ncbi:MAG: shikimate dehydrogenase [Armatimonadota bacterium]|nr:shikimate dehydrogenase [Armatimonadota bacterium]MDR5696637.1 shikimate dehydrogenase [Armatimonadota bacterium]